MNVQRLKDAGIDYDMGLKRFANKAALYERFLGEFINEPHFDQMVQEINAGDIDAAFKTAHSLKGIIGTLAMDDFYSCLYELVEALRNKEQDKVDEYFAKIQIEYKRVYDAIKAE